MKARKLRAVGRMLICGTREELVEALDELIEPKSRLWERVSDIAVGYVVDVLLEGREDLVAGMREVLSPGTNGSCRGEWPRRSSR